MDRMNQLERDLKSREEENAEYRAEKTLREGGYLEKGSGEVIKLVFPDLGMEDVLRIGRAAQKISGAPVAAASTRDAKFAALISPGAGDLRVLLGELLAAHHGRGGGGPFSFQGVFPSGADLKAFLDALPAFPSRDGGA